MAISPNQFLHTTQFHKDNLEAIFKQHIDLPEAPGLLVALIYLQKSINAARDAAAELEKENTNDTEPV